MKLRKEILSCDDGGLTPPPHFGPEGNWYVGIFNISEGPMILGEFFASEEAAREAFDRLIGIEEGCDLLAQHKGGE